jgi:hypothetical protein
VFISCEVWRRVSVLASKGMLVSSYLLLYSYVSIFACFLSIFLASFFGRKERITFNLQIEMRLHATPVRRATFQSSILTSLLLVTGALSLRPGHGLCYCASSTASRRTLIFLYKYLQTHVRRRIYDSCSCIAHRGIVTSTLQFPIFNFERGIWISAVYV